MPLVEDASLSKLRIVYTSVEVVAKRSKEVNIKASLDNVNDTSAYRFSVPQCDCIVYFDSCISKYVLILGIPHSDMYKMLEFDVKQSSELALVIVGYLKDMSRIKK